MESAADRRFAALLEGARGGSGRTLIVAEVGSNHNRDLSLARQLIEAAAEAGADAVKFQLFRAEWLYPPNCGVVETPMGEVEFFEILERYALPGEWIEELSAHATGLGLALLCTPFDEESLRRVARLPVPAVKIASPELNHLPLLREAARLRRPLLCSTGISTLADVEEALAAIRAEWAEAEVILLQCVSAYPVPAEQANLGAIRTLREAFGVPAGLSDHTTDVERVPAIAAALGACVLEKHFTMSRELPGPDHPFALEPGELARMVRILRRVEGLDAGERMAWARAEYGDAAVAEIVGRGRKEIQPAEAPLYPCDKRSIHAIREIAPGEALSPENVRILRSERNLQPGLHPRFWETVLGARVTRRVPLGGGIRWKDLLQR